MAKGDIDQLSFLGGELLPTTPIRRQYLELKAGHPDALLFFQLGDFYETFDDDARLVASELDIALTGREMGRGERVPMAGVPYAAAEGYIARLIQRGHRVALCDQIGEAPPRGLVRREVVRVVTPGTVIEDGLLPSRANNYLAALLVERGGAGLAHVDVSTGQLAVTEVGGSGWQSLVAAELVRLGPAECLITTDGADGVEYAHLLPPGARPTPRGGATFAPHRAAEQICRRLNAATLASVGLDERPLATRAAAVLLAYVEETLPGALDLLDRIEVYSVEGWMVLDAATRRSLELTETIRAGGRTGSLLDALDNTRTPMGARLLRRWVSRPLLDRVQILARHNAVGCLLDDGRRRADVSERLARLPDLERLAGRAAQRILHPRETLALAGGIRALPELRSGLADQGPPLLAELGGRLGSFADVAERVERTIEDPAPARLGDGVIRAGCSAELDETRALAGDGRVWIADFERSERERTGLRGLRVGYNRVFGYYLELSKAVLGQPTDYYQKERSGAATVDDHVERLGYVRRQSLAAAERFVTAQLQEYELRVRNAQDEIARLERRVYSELLEALASRARPLLESARAVAELDALVSLADAAHDLDYVRPVLADDDGLEISDGRHPTVEQFLGEQAFVPNDACLGGSHARIAILTGPNMAGKSTYLRQVALIVLMAQIGSFVPASAARVGLVDRIFARVGAQDDLAAQRSTFMVEMIETANILRNATPRSLVILDEIGRGTSTFDGIAVARAVVEWIHDSPRLGCKTLFATHYHELADLEAALERVQSLRMDVLERGDRVAFLHHVVPGAADRSYGVHVARLAGVPDAVTNRASTILAELEAGRPTVDDGPTACPAARTVAGPAEQSIVDRLVELAPLEMTPLQALTELNSLAELARRASDRTTGRS